MLIPAVLNLPSAISPLWSRNAVSVHSYFPLKSLCWAELFLIALICCILGWEKLIHSDNCSLSPSSAAAPLESIIHPATLPTAPQAVAAAHTGPSHPTLPVQRGNHVMCWTQWHQAPCSKARIFPSAWLTFIHGLKARERPLGGQMEPSILARLPSPDLATNQMDQAWKNRDGAMPSQRGKGSTKGRNQGKGGRFRGVWGLCVCVCLDLAAAGFCLKPFR